MKKQPIEKYIEYADYDRVDSRGSEEARIFLMSYGFQWIPSQLVWRRPSNRQLSKNILEKISALGITITRKRVHK